MNFEELHLLSAIEFSLSNPENPADSSGLNKILTLATAQGLDKGRETQTDIANLNVILKELNSADNSKPETRDEDSDHVRDYRFLELYLHGIRYFQRVKNGEAKYGLKMYRQTHDNDDYTPNSLILLGGNGTGKSSIFGALQWFCLNEIAEAQLRDQADKAQYLIASGENAVTKNQISIVTQNSLRTEEHTTSSEAMAALPLSPFFISEMDLLQMVADIPKSVNEDWTNFFYRLAGYGSIVNLIATFNHLLDVLNQGTKPSTSIDPQSILLSDEFRNLKRYLPFALSTKSEPLEDTLKKLDQAKDYIQSFVDRVTDITTSKEFIDELKQLSTDIAPYRSLKDTFAKDYPWEKDIYNSLVKLNRPIAESGRPGTTANLSEKEIGELKDSARILLKEIPIFIRSGYLYLSRGQAWCDNIVQGKFDFSSIIKKPQNAPNDTAEIKRLIQQYIGRCNDELSKILSALIDQKFFEDICKFWQEAGLLWDDKTMARPRESLHHNLMPSEPIRFYVKVGEEETPEAPSKYFNTFRLKLFVLTLRTFLSIRYMQYKKFRFPIVMDDIFYASDFDNKSKLVHFFTSLFNFYESSSPDANVSLQLILLTHDEQIMAASYKALKDRPDVIFGRLYDYHYAGLDESMCITSLASKEKYQNLYVSLHA